MTHSPLASPTATRDVLARHGLATKKALGQHFLVDDNVVGRILDLAALDGTETVLEVGPGIGTLSVALCGAAGAVVAVERDADLLPVLADTTSGCERFAVVNADAVTVANDEVATPFGPPVALVANLPYQVAATVVLRAFESMDSIRSATVMVQAEVADRMAASPGSKDYGAYTVKLSLRARVAGRFNVGPGCFFPPPRVESAVIRLDRRGEGLDEATLEAAARVAESAFAQRRKTLRNSLKATSGFSAVQIDAALEAVGIDGRVRAETLEPEAFLRIARALATAHPA